MPMMTLAVAMSSVARRPELEMEATGDQLTLNPNTQNPEP